MICYNNEQVKTYTNLTEQKSQRESSRRKHELEIKKKLK